MLSLESIETENVVGKTGLSFASKGSNNYILFAITAAGVVLCGGPKKSPPTSSIVQIIFFF